MSEAVDVGYEEEDWPRVNVKEAVKAARDYFLSLYEGQELPNLRLEEVELSSDGSKWYITFGFTASEQDIENSPLSGVFGGGRTVRTHREYKRIEVSATTGRPLKMKIRKV